MNLKEDTLCEYLVSAGCHINDVMNERVSCHYEKFVSAGCHINDVMNI